MVIFISILGKYVFNFFIECDRPVHFPLIRSFSSWNALLSLNPVNIYFFKFNNGNTRALSEICSDLTIETTDQHQWHHPGVFIPNFEQISLIALVFPLLILNK